MKWLKPEKDYYRWRKAFALFPTRIGDEVIWLEKYEWRHDPDLPYMFHMVRLIDHK